MAGRYVVLEFDDSDSADTFCQNENLGANLGYRVNGLFVKPQKFCQCPDKKRQDNRNWARGKRTGLWLCKRCRRASIFHQKGLMERLLYIFGYNQLQVEWEDE